MLDIDYFKRINDTYGHACGDRALQRLVEACVGTLRAIDHFGRVGGEEFVCVLPETGAADALVWAERKRSHIPGCSPIASSMRGYCAPCTTPSPG